MDPIRRMICPGVGLHTVQTDKFKSSQLTVNLFVPLRKETASAYSLLTDVLTRGTERYPTMRDLHRRRDELYSLGLGAYVHKIGESQVVTFALLGLDDAYAFDGMHILEEGMELLGQVVFHPATEGGVFRASYVEQEKRNLANDIRARIDDKTSYAYRRCLELMCAGEPYAVDHEGDLDELEKLDAKTLWDAYRTLLAEARVELFYVGSKSDGEVFDLCRKYLPFAPREADFPPTGSGRAPEVPRVVTERMDVTQSKLNLGFRTSCRLSAGDYGKLVLFNELFGASPNSRLFLNVREKQSLCYYCSSGSDGGLKGLLVVHSGIERKNRQKAVDAILAQLDDLRAGHITDGELETARRSLRDSYREISDSPSALSSWYLRRMTAGVTDSPEDVLARLDDVTVADVVSVANDLRLDTVYCLEGTEKEENA